MLCIAQRCQQSYTIDTRDKSLNEEFNTITQQNTSSCQWSYQVLKMMTCAKFESQVNVAMQTIIQGLSIVWWCVFWKLLVMWSLVYMDSVALVSAWVLHWWHFEELGCCVQFGNSVLGRLLLHVQCNVDVFCWILLNQQSCLACLCACVQCNVDVFCWVLLNQQSWLVCLHACWCMFNVILTSFDEYFWANHCVLNFWCGFCKNTIFLGWAQ